MRVRFTPSGRTQFLAAVTYIRADNVDAARRFRRRAEQILRRLERFPNSGRKVPEFPAIYLGNWCRRRGSNPHGA